MFGLQCTTVVRSHLENCAQAWAPYLQMDINDLVKVWNLGIKMMADERHKSCEKLHDLGILSQTPTHAW